MNTARRAATRLYSNKHHENLLARTKLVMAAVQQPPTPPASPPHKRARMHQPEAGPSTPVTESPAHAMFAPLRTKGEIKKRRKMKHPIPEPYSVSDVLWHDVCDFLGHQYVQALLAQQGDQEWQAPKELELRQEVTVRVGAFTVSGDCLSLYQPQGSDKKWSIVAPFGHPGDLIRVRVMKHDRLHSHADLVEILEYDETYRGGDGDRRKNPEAGCKYFGSCGGCQFQPMPYAQQLLHKKRTVHLAFQRFSRLGSDLLPTIQDTIPSPRQWGYRTKLTPHFDAAPKWVKEAVSAGRVVRRGENGSITVWVEDQKPQSAEEDVANGGEKVRRERTWEPRIGFGGKTNPSVLDIEDCPIGTRTINKGMKEARKRIQEGILSYQRGATLLLRESLPTPDAGSIAPFKPSTPPSSELEPITITDHKAAVYERVGDKLFTFTAGSFFQNNNSILVPLTDYVRQAIFPPGIADDKKPTHLVDTYCGSGLFGITLSSGFQRVAGVEIDPQAVEAAKKNAAINNLGDKSTWLCGKAEDIFGDLPAAGFAGQHSCVVVDPPRKGCDEPFLEQLLAFKPLTVVYVSCNVHTQARDVGWFLKVGHSRGIKYNLESLRGFDLFPQTAHVEGVAVLRLAD